MLLLMVSAIELSRTAAAPPPETLIPVTKVSSAQVYCEPYDHQSSTSSIKDPLDLPFNTPFYRESSCLKAPPIQTIDLERLFYEIRPVFQERPLANDREPPVFMKQAYDFQLLHKIAPHLFKRPNALDDELLKSKGPVQLLRARAGIPYEVALRLVIIMARYGIDASHLGKPDATSWSISDLDNAIWFLDQLPPWVFPLQNRYDPIQGKHVPYFLKKLNKAASKALSVPHPVKLRSEFSSAAGSVAKAGEESRLGISIVNDMSENSLLKSLIHEFGHTLTDTILQDRSFDIEDEEKKKKIDPKYVYVNPVERDWKKVGSEKFKKESPVDSEKSAKKSEKVKEFLYEYSPCAPSLYSYESLNEDIAESFVWFLQNPEEMKQNCPEKYAILSKTFKIPPGSKCPQMSTDKDYGSKTIGIYPLSNIHEAVKLFDGCQLIHSLRSSARVAKSLSQCVELNVKKWVFTENSWSEADRVLGDTDLVRMSSFLRRAGGVQGINETTSVAMRYVEHDFELFWRNHLSVLQAYLKDKNKWSSSSPCEHRKIHPHGDKVFYILNSKENKPNLPSGQTQAYPRPIDVEKNFVGRLLLEEAKRQKVDPVRLHEATLLNLFLSVCKAAKEQNVDFNLEESSPELDKIIRSKLTFTEP